MGVRVALGAQRLDILRLVFGQSLSVGSPRAVVGLGIVVATAPFWSDLLFQTSRTIPSCSRSPRSSCFASGGLASSLRPGGQRA